MTVPVILDASGEPVRSRRPRLMGGSYQASSGTHQDLATWWPSRSSPESALAYERDLMVARVHDIARNDGWASAAMDRQVDNVVGSGWRLSAKPNARSLGISEEAAADFADAIEAEWQDYCDDPGFWCDVGRRGPAGQLLALAYRHRVADGEALGVLYWLPRGGDFATAMQVVHPDRLSNPEGRAESDQLREGVEMDAVGAPSAYHIRARHPGDDYLLGGNPYVWERIPRETAWGRPIVVHAFESRGAGQVRGEPPLAPILRKLKQITRYDEAELQAATLNAVLAAFVTSPFDHETLAETIGSGNDKELGAYQEGRLAYYGDRPIRLPGVQATFMYPGEDVKLTQPQHPNAGAENFVRSGLRNIASAVGLTYEQLTMDWSQVNYSSARGALLEIWRSLSARKNAFAAQFMQPWYSAWLEEAIETGRLVLPAGARPFAERRSAWCQAEWIGPGRGWVDPQKEADAAATRLDAGLSTLERECAEQGLDWKRVAQQRARERAFLMRMGLDPDQSLRAAQSRQAVAPASEAG
jgi:lambda family phage portal protein